MVTLRPHASNEFWNLYHRLAPNVQVAPDKQFALFRQDPTHPSLRLKPVGELWSACINEAYRVLAVREGDLFYWFWMGSHDEYERLISR